MAKKLPKEAQAKLNSQSESQSEADYMFRQGTVNLRDIIAPSSFEVETTHIKLGNDLIRTIFVYGYPRQLYTGWLSSIINLDEVLDINQSIVPVESRVVMDNLKKKVTQLQASNSINSEKGKIRDPALDAALRDAEEMRDKLQLGEERFFRFGLYVTFYGKDLDELDYIGKKIESIFATNTIYTKSAAIQMEQGFNSTLPLGNDKLKIFRNMSTGVLSTSFPFTTAELSHNSGILYGINRHNNGLVLFDRFSLENYNMVVFATSGAGKSYAVKLEALRLLMMGTEILVIDPENEYENLCNAVGGSYIKVSLSSDTRINPFDLPIVVDSDEADSILRSNIIMLSGLIRLMIGGLSPNEEGDLDLALITTYAKKGITDDPLTHRTKPPTMADLISVLNESHTSTGPAIASKLSRYTNGSFSGLFSEESNINMNNKFIVFNIRDLEDELRPVAMYIVLNFIWNKVKAEKKRRMLIVDEAWLMMQYQDSAQFLFSVAKRARKYNLGLTTISQDVEDFLGTRLGRAIVSNSSLQLLLKQNPSAVDVIAETFRLTSEEKKRLTQFPVGEGLFFAGLSHIIISIYSSQTEHQFVTTNPNELKGNSYK